MMRWKLAVGMLLACILGTGCVSVGHVQTADTLGSGKFQFAMEPGVGGTAVISDVASGSIYYPHVDLALRYGVTEWLDLGVRFGSSLIEAQGKVLLTDVRDPKKAISIAPALSGLFIGSGSDEAGASGGVGYYNLAVPVLIGFKSAGGSELVLGPRLTFTRVTVGASAQSASSNVAVNVLSTGASVGYALRVSEGFRLMPEIAVSFPVIGDVEATASNSGNSVSDSEVLSGFAGGFVQFKLGFLFGQGRPIRRVAMDEAETEEAAPEAEATPEATPEARSESESKSAAPAESGSEAKGKGKAKSNTDDDFRRKPKGSDEDEYGPEY